MTTAGSRPSAPGPAVSAPHIVTLVAASAVGPMAMNLFLPSLPGMARHFQVDYGVMQLSVTLYLAATAVLQLLIGPASDRYGRRPVLIASMIVFFIGTIMAMIAPDAATLLAARVLQAFAAAGMVLSRAIVRDTMEAADTASRIGYVTMGMALVPMVAPTLGGLLDEIYDWRASFMLMLALGLVAFAFILFDLKETNRTRAASLAAQIRSYPELLRERLFWGYTATSAFASGTFFAFLGGGPYVASEMMRLRPSQYGLYFAILSVGYLLGNFLSGRYARRLGIDRMMVAGNLVATAGLVVASVLLAAGAAHPLSLFGPMVLLGVGNGLTLPSANAGIVSVRPSLAGSASGVGGALQIGGGAALAAVAGMLLSPDSGPAPLLAVMLASSVASVSAALWTAASRRSSDAAQEP